MCICFKTVVQGLKSKSLAHPETNINKHIRMILICLTCTPTYDISQVMGVPAKLTERQIKFAELLVYNEGRISASEAAYQAGYKTRPRQAASELRNPKKSPLVVRYIGELRAEVQEKYGISFERHITELAKIRDDARAKGAWSAATNAEVARGKAGGLYVDQKLILSANVDNLSEQEIKDKMKKILEDHKDLIEGTATEVSSVIDEQPQTLKKLN